MASRPRSCSMTPWVQQPRSCSMTPRVRQPAPPAAVPRTLSGAPSSLSVDSPSLVSFGKTPRGVRGIQTARTRLPEHGFICTNVSLGVVWCAEKGPRHKRLIGLGSRAGAGVTGRRVGHPAFSRGSPGRKQERDVGVHQNQPSDCNFTASRTELHSKIGAVIKVLEIR